MSIVPRNGQYELFTNNRKTYCFDESSNPIIVNAPEEMWSWLRSTEGVRPLDETNVAYYLTPEIYLIWKLRWS